MSLEPIKYDILKKAANLTTAQSDVDQVKLIIVDHTRISIRVLSVKHGIIRLRAESAPAASEIFAMRHELLEAINRKLKSDYKKIYVGF